MSFRQRVSRHDRYDLRLLNDAPEFRRPSRDDPECGLEAPDWEAETDDALYCHRCDGALPAGMVICPGCGAHLG